MTKDETKMTVKLPTALHDRFMRQLDQLALKRDAFLTSMLEVELPHLERELGNRRLSVRARRHIAGSLKRMGTTKVNVVLSKRLSGALARCVSNHGLVRDAVVARLIAFLRAEKPLLHALELPEVVDQREFRALVQEMPTSPLKAMEELRTDPLYYLRVAIEERHQVGLWLVPLPRRWDGLSCFLPDEYVPGTPAWRTRETEVSSLLD